jgi:hypothetical protein
VALSTKRPHLGALLPRPITAAVGAGCLGPGLHWVSIWSSVRSARESMIGAPRGVAYHGWQAFAWSLQPLVAQGMAL